MIMGRHMIAICVFMLAGTKGPAIGIEQTRDVRALSWEASNKNLELLKSACSKEMLSDWLIELTSFAVSDGTQSWFRGAKVIDYRFIDLNKDGVYDLVMEVKENTSADDGPIEVIFRKGDRFVLQEVPGKRSFGDFDGAIRDLNGDGKYEIVTMESLADHRGGYLPQIDYPAVYHVSVDKTERVDGQYPAVYREFIGTCNMEIQKVKSANPSFGPGELEDATVQWLIPQDKALRALGVDKKAGLAAAIAWSASKGNSVVPDKKELAIDVLGDIDDANSSGRLIEMAEGDPDWLIREFAVQALFRVGRGRFVTEYVKLLKDPFYDSNGHQFPVRETVAAMLRELGIHVEGANGNYEVKK
jgi:hypothetical protein